MATPFAPYANARMRFDRRSSRIPNFRNGGRVMSESVVLDVYVKLFVPQGTNNLEAGATELKSQFLSGYITRWAPLPNGSDWLSLGTSWAWNESGLKPEGLYSGTKLETYIGDLTLLPARDGSEVGYTEIRSAIYPFGVGGIGDMIRVVAGDKILGIYSFAS